MNPWLRTVWFILTLALGILATTLAADLAHYAKLIKDANVKPE